MFAVLLQYSTVSSVWIIYLSRTMGKTAETYIKIMLEAYNSRTWDAFPFVQVFFWGLQKDFLKIFISDFPISYIDCCAFYLFYCYGKWDLFFYHVFSLVIVCKYESY